MSYQKAATHYASLTLMLAWLAGTVLVAGEYRATAEEAQALVAAAIEFYDEEGMEAAFAAIEDPDGALVDRDLYIFVYGPGRTIVAHGADTSLVGSVADTLIDIDGVPFGSQFMDLATEEGVWVDYKWYDPVTKEVLPKTSWVVLHDSYIFGAGIYDAD
ncbi:MAG TPA: cache domain-containing protein [Xanthomonadales bacterium]|nr:cache domain-containing protein [Xanthomonadales bacterium]